MARNPSAGEPPRHPSDDAAAAPLQEHRLHPSSILFGAFGTLREYLVFFLVGGTASVAVLLDWPDAPGWFQYLPRPWDPASFEGIERLLFVTMPVALIVVGTVVKAVFTYVRFRYSYGDTDLIVRTGGVFSRRERHIPYARIHGIEVVKRFWHRPFKVVEVNLHTAGAVGAEAVMSGLPETALDVFRHRLAEGGARVRSDAEAVSQIAEPVPEVAEPVPKASGTASRSQPQGKLLHISVRDLCILGLVENRGLLICGGLSGYLFQFVDWESRYLAAFRAVGQLAGSTQAGIAVAALLVVFALWVAWTVLRYHNFTVVLRENDLRVSYGLLTRVVEVIPLRRIQSVVVHEGPLHQLAGRAAIGIKTAGGPMDTHQASRRWLAPLIPRAEVGSFVEQIAPDLRDGGGVEWQPVDPRAMRRILNRLLPAAVAIFLFVWLSVTLPWAIVCGAGLLGCTIIHARRRVRCLGWAVQDGIVWVRKGWLWRNVAAAPLEKVQGVAAGTSPFDRRWKMAWLAADTAGAGPVPRMRVPFLPADTARKTRQQIAASIPRTAFRW